MLVNCRLTSLNYLIQRKTIVVVGRCITLPNDDLLAESNFWWYLQLISATLPAYISIHWNMLCSQNMFVTFSSFFNSPKWMILSPRRVLDVYTEHIPPSLCPWGWLLGWIHSVDPWDLLTLHQGTGPSTSEVPRRWILHERRSTRPLLQIYTIRN